LYDYYEVRYTKEGLFHETKTLNETFAATCTNAYYKSRDTMTRWRHREYSWVM